MTKHIPNLITICRLFLAIAFFYLYLNDNVANSYLFMATIIFFIAAITDTLDGWLARKLNAVSKWGEIVDPLIDKVLTFLAFVAFANTKIVEIWMVAIIIARDVITTVLRMAFFTNKNIPTSKSAKFKTFIQMSFIFIILILQSLNELTIYNYNDIIYSDWTYYTMLGITVLTVWTMLEYLLKINQINKKKRAGMI